MHERVRGWLESGKVSGLGSEGRLVFAFACHLANWNTAHFKASQRHLADEFKCHRTTVKRGFEQLTDAGILRVAQGGSGTRWPKFEICEPQKEPTRRNQAPPARVGHTSCPDRTHLVSGGGHTSCP